MNAHFCQSIRFAVKILMTLGSPTRHDDFRLRTVWSLFNAFTETLKGNLTDLPRRTEALHGLLDHHVGLSA